MAFNVSRTSAAQTAVNVAATIAAALINSKAVSLEGSNDEVAAQALEVVAHIATPIREHLDTLVAEDREAEAARPAPKRQAGAKPYEVKDPGAEKLTKPVSEGGTSKVGGMTIREIYALPQSAGLTGKGSGVDYITRLADAQFGTAGMQKKAQAFLATLSPADKASGQPITSPEHDYLGS